MTSATSAVIQWRSDAVEALVDDVARAGAGAVGGTGLISAAGPPFGIGGETAALAGAADVVAGDSSVGMNRLLLSGWPA
jgi:hypothetical protein